MGKANSHTLFFHMMSNRAPSDLSTIAKVIIHRRRMATVYVEWGIFLNPYICEVRLLNASHRIVVRISCEDKHGLI